MAAPQQGSTKYQQKVLQYLVSTLGKATPDATAKQLLGLVPASIGMPEEPTMAHLHATRAFLEVAFAPDNDQLEVDQSGLFMMDESLRVATA